MGKLFLLFAIMPIVEISLLIQVGEQIGGWNTVLIVILTAIIGAYLVRSEGLATLQAAQAKLNSGAMPGEEMAQGLLLLVAGVLLVTPGFVTDALGLLFTVPLTRNWFARGLIKHLQVQVVSGQQGFEYRAYQQQRRSADDDIIEGEYRRTDASDDERLPHDNDRRP
ncbi:FxsA family protein [Aestuariibacter halophilus]|uniref:FxsA family protein n=1 Tax=Fluctibacter halophilus TaxID=226011 RepID=A0ABS8G9K5_9ALTE|nr:FxsA family protein [Aestuariibacter halophilus]MCC2617103.1 FxsA family protein [Aestuariibacter halophilus]